MGAATWPVPCDGEAQGGAHPGYARDALRSLIIEATRRMLYDGAQHHGAHVGAISLEGEADQHAVRRVVVMLDHLQLLEDVLCPTRGDANRRGKTRDVSQCRAAAVEAATVTLGSCGLGWG